jgi:hypothetical protein
MSIKKLNIANNFLLEHQDNKLEANLRNILSYENIFLDEKCFSSSTSYFIIKNKEIFSSKQRMPVNTHLPDFIVNNFNLYEKDNKNMVMSFLKMFLTEILFLNYKTEIQNKTYLYNLSKISFVLSQNIFKNKMCVVSVFKRFFKNHIKIEEYLPKKINNSMQFSLGCCNIFSKNSKNKFSLGQSINVFLSRISVTVIVDYEEINNLLAFLKYINFNRNFLIFSSNKKNSSKQYKIKFVLEKNKCISAVVYPSIKELSK